MEYMKVVDPLLGVSIVRVEEDGTQVWLGLREEDPKYVAWLEEGNIPETWRAEL